MEEQTRVLEYKCPCCNAGLHFGSDAQKLTCEYCGNTFDLDTVRAFNESQNPQGDEEFQWEPEQTESFSEDEESTLRVFQCPSCGGEILCDENTAASFCPYCENPTIMPTRLSGGLKPDGVIPRHAGLTDRLDYEAELAVVLGKAARDVKAADAADYIFGYTVLNDVSARDLQTGHKQWYFGKSLDGFTPMGPVLVTADEIAYPPALEITSRVNGELRQKSNTALLITSIGQILEEGNRTAAGPTVPAGGLYMSRLWYDDGIEKFSVG